MDMPPVGPQGAVDRGFVAGLRRAVWAVVFVLVPAVPLHAADVFVQNETVTGGRTVSCPDGSIYAGPAYAIAPPGNVTFKAFGVICLRPGFTVSRGAVFRAYPIGTESDPDVRYTVVTGTVVLNGAGAANVALAMSGFNTYGRWVSRTAVTDSQGNFTFTLAEGAYALSEQEEAYAFTAGGAAGIRVSGTSLSISPGATVLMPVDTHFAYYHHDLFGNSAAMTGDDGRVVMRSVFYPFGDLYGAEGASERYLFTGKERDATGLDYFGARYFEPGLGRFTGVDRREGRVDDPRTWNRYVYCSNNPYTYVDPDGNWGRDVHLDKTYEMAKEYVSEKNARTIAVSCDRVDGIFSGKSPLPGIGNQSYHFNTNSDVPGARDSRVIVAEDKLNKAISLHKQGKVEEAMKELGEGLHAIEDMCAHNRKYQKSILGVAFHLGPDADNTKVDPGRIEETKKMVRHYLGAFIHGISESKEPDEKEAHNEMRGL